MGIIGTIIGYWVQHRLAIKKTTFANLHAQKILLYPQLLDLVDKTIASIERALSKENNMKKSDLERIADNLRNFTFLPNVMLISDTKLARLMSSFTSTASSMFGILGYFVFFIEKGMTEGIRYQPTEWQLESLKEIRKKMFNVIRKEMGAKAVRIAE